MYFGSDDKEAKSTAPIISLIYFTFALCFFLLARKYKRKLNKILENSNSV